MKGLFFLVLATISSIPIFAQGVIQPNTTLSNDQEVHSQNRRYFLRMQRDGNLVIYGPGGAKWATGTNGRSNVRAVMQGDGNLVLYSPNGAIWDTQTHGNPGSRLVMQNNGNLVILNPQGKAIWNSGSQAKAGDFPIHAPANCNKIKGKSWRCCGEGALNSNGIFSVRIKTSSNRAEGFTGAINFRFLDARGKELYFVNTNSFGVNAYDTRHDIFETMIRKDILPLVVSIEAEGIHTPTRRPLKKITEYGAKALEAYLLGGN